MLTIILKATIKLFALSGSQRQRVRHGCDRTPDILYELDTLNASVSATETLLMHRS